MLRVFFLGLLSLGFISSSHAEELTFQEIIASFTEAVSVRETTGRIEVLNYSARTATIGGYRYHFGPSTLETPLKVKLLGRNFGSLELLDVGMDVRVIYFESPTEHRIATELTQIEESEQH